jgi:hypothetical protein
LVRVCSEIFPIHQYESSSCKQTDYSGTQAIKYGFYCRMTLIFQKKTAAKPAAKAAAKAVAKPAAKKAAPAKAAAKKKG